RLIWVTVIACLVMTLDVRPCVAQAAASATIKAKVHAAPKSLSQGAPNAAAAQSQTVSLSLDVGSSRAQLRTPTGAPITLELQGTSAARVTLLVQTSEAPSVKRP